MEGSFSEVRIARSDPGVLDRGIAPCSSSSRAWVRWGRGRGEEESVNDDLRQKILDIICKEGPTPDGYLLSFDIYEAAEKPRRRGYPRRRKHRAIGAGDERADNPFVFGGRWPPPGGAAVHDIEDDLCE